jgi:hypothetical protein
MVKLLAYPGDRETVALPPKQNGTSVMTDVEKRITQLETQASEAMQLAESAGEPATRTFLRMQAEDLTALAKTLRPPGVATRAT